MDPKRKILHTGRDERLLVPGHADTCPSRVFKGSLRMKLITRPIPLFFVSGVLLFSSWTICTADEADETKASSARTPVQEKALETVKRSVSSMPAGPFLKNNPLPKMDRATDTLRVLLIGSSWGMDTISRFSEVVRAGGIRNVVGDLYHSGVTFKQHAEFAEKSSREYTYTKWVDGKLLTASKEQTALAGLTDEKWDVVILMQGACESGLWQTYQPYMEQFVRWVAKNATNEKVVFALNSTWAKASWSNVWKTYPTQQDMIDRSRQSAKNALKATGIDLILPTGTAIDNARHSGLAKTAQTRDLARDDVHLDLGIGRYITACTLFEAIVKPIFGLSVEGNTFRDATDTEHNTPITDQNAPVAQKCAILAVRNPWSRTPVTE